MINFFLSSENSVQSVRIQLAAIQRLSENERWHAVRMLQTGGRQVDVARTFNVTHSVVSRLWNRCRQTLQVNDLPRSGWPRSTTRHEDRVLVNRAIGNRSLSATQLRQQLQRVTGTQVSAKQWENQLTPCLSACIPQALHCVSYPSPTAIEKRVGIGQDVTRGRSSNNGPMLLFHSIEEWNYTEEQERPRFRMCVSVCV